MSGGARRRTGERWLAACRRLVALAGLLAPGSRREAHRREWDAELVAWWRAQAHQGTGVGMRLRALRRALLSALDALDLRRLHAARGTAARSPAGPASRARRASVAESIGADLRYALRSLRTRPQWTAVALLTLALGIGASTVISSVVRSVVWKPLPYPQPERLVDVWPEMWWTKEMIDWLREEASSYQAVAGWSESGFRWNREEGSEIVEGPEVTAELLEVLGRGPILGRDLERADETPERDHLLVTHGFWQEQLGGSPDVIGSILRIEDRPGEVVGVLPPGMPLLQRDARVVRPLDMSDGDVQRRNHYLHVVARLAPGVTVEQASAELRTLAERWRERGDRSDDWGRGAKAVPLRAAMIEEVRPTMTLLLAAIVCTLLVATANVANLLLVRSVERRGEVAVRAALGARPGRLTRQALTESTLLASVGGTLGIGAAVLGLRLVVRLLPYDLPRVEEIALDGGMLALSLALTVGVGWVVGLAPAWHARRVQLRPDARGGAGDRAGSRLRASLVIGEVALAVLLLVGAGLLTKSFLRALAVDVGVTTEGVLTLVVIPETRRFADAEEVSSYFRLLEERIAALPEVRSVASAHAVPVQNSGWTMGIWPEGEPPPEGQDPQWVNWRPVSVDYFEATGSGLAAGRWFDERDGAGAPRVAILSETAERVLFGERSALGDRVVFPWEGREPITVVGIARDVRIAGPRSDPPPVVYRPYDQAQAKLQSIHIAWRSLVIATAGDPRAVLPAVEATVAEVDRGAAVHRVETMEEILAENLSGARVTALLVGCFALAAFLLGAIGVYGVMERSVSERAREIAIRLALGGSRRDVLSSVLGRGQRLAMTGAALGLLGALAASRLLEGLLFEVSPRDPWVFAGVAVGLAAIALLATWWPARRAARTDPARALAVE